MITTEDCLWFIDEALNGMVRIVSELGDDLANRAPDLPDANSPYAILTHCLGVLESWGGSQIAGRAIQRDREAEFLATGTVDDLVARCAAARERFGTDLDQFEPSEPIRGAIKLEEADRPYYRHQGGVLVHLVEELAQHRGQMEVTRDLLHAPWAKLTGPAA